MNKEKCDFYKWSVPMTHDRRCTMDTHGNENELSVTLLSKLCDARFDGKLPVRRLFQQV